MAALYDKVKQSLAQAGVACVHYAGVIPNPTTEEVTRGAEMARAEGVEVVIGLGGGSYPEQGLWRGHGILLRTG